jgi:hypothetical protein
MPKKIFTAPAPFLVTLADKIQALGLTAELGASDPDTEDGVIIWIESKDADGLDDVPELIALAADAWDDYER